MKIIGIKLRDGEPQVIKNLKPNTWYSFGDYKEPSEIDPFPWTDKKEQDIFLSDLYRRAVDEFHREERYNYHKCEALRLYDLYHDYSSAHIQMLADMFAGQKTIKEVEDDIFGIDFSNNHDRSFDKLKRDVKKQSKR